MPGSNSRWRRPRGPGCGGRVGSGRVVRTTELAAALRRRRERDRPDRLVLDELVQAVNRAHTAILEHPPPGCGLRIGLRQLVRERKRHLLAGETIPIHVDPVVRRSRPAEEVCKQAGPRSTYLSTLRNEARVGNRPARATVVREYTCPAGALAIFPAGQERIATVADAVSHYGSRTAGQDGPAHGYCYRDLSSHHPNLSLQFTPQFSIAASLSAATQILLAPHVCSPFPSIPRTLRAVNE